MAQKVLKWVVSSLGECYLEKEIYQKKLNIMRYILLQVLINLMPMENFYLDLIHYKWSK